MTDLGQLPPKVELPLPGRRAAGMVEVLAETECPSFTTRRKRRAERAGAPNDPIVWREAVGANVVDADGNVFVDLTAGFSVAALGHRHPKIVEAVKAQTETLMHALGDLHPSTVKIQLLTRLAELSPWPDARVILALSGSDAVEAALKTAVLATGRAGVLAFTGGYHGLAHGPLAACGYHEGFRAPFDEQLNPHVTFAPFPREGETSTEDAIAAVASAWPGRLSRGAAPGVVLVEPIQGRGGVIVPPKGFIAALGELARERGALLAVDEIFTAFGRTGVRFRSVADGAEPDLLCVGKALGGGMPVCACMGRSEVMAAWGDPDGAALHTGTFFGHPIGCAAALAALSILEDEGVYAEGAARGEYLRGELDRLAGRHSDLVSEVRGVGLMLGVDLGDGARTLRVVQKLLERGYLTLPAGPDASTLQLVPPLTIPEALLGGFVEAFDAVLSDLREHEASHEGEEEAEP